MGETQYKMEDELDLRELVLTLLRGWKIIAAAALLAGAAAFGYTKLQPEVYEAQTLVFIDAAALHLSVDPESLLTSDHVIQLAAEELGAAPDEMPQPIFDSGKEKYPSLTVSMQGDTETVYRILVRGDDPVFVYEAASALANAGIDSISEFTELFIEQHEKAYLELAEADRALLEYLDAEGLDSWSWMDLALLTGFGKQPSILLSQGLPYGSEEGTYTLEGFPPVDVDQREEIIRLMRARADAEEAYELIKDKFEVVRVALETKPPQILNQPVMPKDPIGPKLVRNSVLGVVVGGLVGVMLVFVLAWIRELVEMVNG